MSRISFGRLLSRAWTDEEGMAPDRAHHADLYVFCLQTSESLAGQDVFDLSQWDFYVVPVETLKVYKYRSIGLQALAGMVPRLRAAEVRPAVEAFAGGKNPFSTNHSDPTTGLDNTLGSPFWDEAHFFSGVSQCCSEAGAIAVRRLYEWSANHGADFAWTKSKGPSVTARWLVNGKPVSCWNVNVTPDGLRRLYLNFSAMRQHLGPDTMARFAERLRSVAAIKSALPGLRTPDDLKYPSLPIDVALVEPMAIETVEDALAEALEGPPLTASGLPANARRSLGP